MSEEEAKRKTPAEVVQAVADAFRGAVTRRFALMPGALAITKERERQILEEGYTRERDMGYPPGSLLSAGLAYLMIADAQMRGKKLPQCFVPRFWPWCRQWWKPAATPRRNLEKAAALFMAEWDAQETREAGKGGN